MVAKAQLVASLMGVQGVALHLVIRVATMPATAAMMEAPSLVVVVLVLVAMRQGQAEIMLAMVDRAL
jgi:hypothetical protein